MLDLPFSEEQSSVEEVAKKHGVSVETRYRWRRAYGGMELPEVKRLKQLEQENAQLKKLLAERDLEVEVMKEIAAKNGEHVDTPPAGGVRPGSGRFMSTRMRRSERGALVAALRVQDGGQRRAGGRTDARLLGALSALWLPACAHPARSRRHPDEPGPSVSTAEEGGASSPVTATNC
jgi:putative transposase